VVLIFVAARSWAPSCSGSLFPQPDPVSALRSLAPNTDAALAFVRDLRTGVF
jgi:hypothetical protein